ncbi:MULTISPECIES: hypothetical protein [Methylocystaceae]
MGDKFAKENLPVLDAFAARVRNDEGVNSGVAKEGGAVAGLVGIGLA